MLEIRKIREIATEEIKKSKAFDLIKQGCRDYGKPKKASELFKEYISETKDIKALQNIIYELSKSSEIDLLSDVQHHLDLKDIKVIDDKKARYTAYGTLRNPRRGDETLSDEKIEENMKLLDECVIEAKKRKIFLIDYLEEKLQIDVKVYRNIGEVKKIATEEIKRLKAFDLIGQGNYDSGKPKKASELFEEYVSETKDIKALQNIICELGERNGIDLLSDVQHHLDLQGIKVIDDEQARDVASKIVSSQKSGADPLVNPEQKPHDESSSANLPQITERPFEKVGSDDQAPKRPREESEEGTEEQPAKRVKLQTGSHDESSSANLPQITERPFEKAGSDDQAPKRPREESEEGTEEQPAKKRVKLQTGPFPTGSHDESSSASLPQITERPSRGDETLSDEERAENMKLLGEYVLHTKKGKAFLVKYLEENLQVDVAKFRLKRIINDRKNFDTDIVELRNQHNSIQERIDSYRAHAREIGIFIVHQGEPYKNDPDLLESFKGRPIEFARYIATELDKTEGQGRMRQKRLEYLIEDYAKGRSVTGLLHRFKRKELYRMTDAPLVLANSFVHGPINAYNGRRSLLKSEFDTHNHENNRYNEEHPHLHESLKRGSFNYELPPEIPHLPPLEKAVEAEVSRKQASIRLEQTESTRKKFETDLLELQSRYTDVCEVYGTCMYVVKRVSDLLASANIHILDANKPDLLKSFKERPIEFVRYITRGKVLGKKLERWLEHYEKEGARLTGRSPIGLIYGYDNKRSSLQSEIDMHNYENNCYNQEYPHLHENFKCGPFNCKLPPKIPRLPPLEEAIEQRAWERHAEMLPGVSTYAC